MKTVIFRVDDHSPAFWQRDTANVWEAEGAKRGWEFEDFAGGHLRFESLVRTAALRRKDSTRYLVTDQQLWGGNFDGADLAAKLINDGVIGRAAVFSQVAALRPDHDKRRIIAETRIILPRAITGLFRYLETGHYPRTDELFGLIHRIESTQMFFRENVRCVAPEMLASRLLRPANTYGDWKGTPGGSEFLFDPWMVGFGPETAMPFSDESKILFAEDIGDEVIQFLGGRHNQDALQKWERVCHCLDPWKSLEQAGGLRDKTTFVGGAFRLLWETGRCGGRHRLIPDALMSEHVLSPREKAWVRVQRCNLRHRIAELMQGDGASLARGIQNCIKEVELVIEDLTAAEAIRDEN